MNLGLNKVIADDETGFRGKDDGLCRSEGWDFLLAGGGVYSNLDYSFTPGHPAGTLHEYQSPERRLLAPSGRVAEWIRRQMKCPFVDNQAPGRRRARSRCAERELPAGYGSAGFLFCARGRASGRLGS
jgi:hypothetical protein